MDLVTALAAIHHAYIVGVEKRSRFFEMTLGACLIPETGGHPPILGSMRLVAIHTPFVRFGKGMGAGKLKLGHDALVAGGAKLGPGLLEHFLGGCVGGVAIYAADFAETMNTLAKGKLFFVTAVARKTTLGGFAGRQCLRADDLCQVTITLDMGGPGTMAGLTPFFLFPSRSLGMPCLLKLGYNFLMARTTFFAPNIVILGKIRRSTVQKNG